MKKTRLLALVLALVMVVAIFAACGDVEPEETTTAATTTEATTTEATTNEGTTAATTTEAPTETTTEATTADPRLDQGGRVVTIASAFIGDMTPTPGTSEFHDNWQAVYDSVAEDLNIELQLISGPHEYADAMPFLMSGDLESIGDISNGKIHIVFPMAINGYAAQLNTDEMANFGLNVTDENAFFQPYTTAMSLNGDIYGCLWNGPYFVCEFGWCMFVNLDYVNEYGGETDIFQTVRDMNWTWEKFLDLQEKCTKDLDGDGTIDIWGSGEHSYGQEIYTIPGGATVYYDEASGKYLSGLSRVETQEALQFAQNYYNSGFCETSTGYGDIHRMFIAGEVAMQWGEQWNTAPGNYFDGADTNYGILPIPKHADAQTYTNVLGGVKSFYLMKGNEDFELNAFVLQKLGEAFTDTDAVWDTFLTENAAGNEQSVEMVQDYIWGQYATTVTDYSWTNWTELQQWYRENVYFPIVTGKSTIAEVVGAQDASFQSIIDNVFGQ